MSEFSLPVWHVEILGGAVRVLNFSEKIYLPADGGGAVKKNTQISQFGPDFTIWTRFLNLDQISQFHPQFDQILQFQPNFTISTKVRSIGTPCHTGFLDRKSVRSFGTPRQTGFWIKHLRGQSGPRVTQVFGPNICEVIQDPVSHRFLDQTSVRSFGTPRHTGFWTEHLWGHLGPRVTLVFGPKICEVIRDRTSVRSFGKIILAGGKIILAG